MHNFLMHSKKYYSTMVDIRRELHMHPEFDRDLNYTASVVERYLKAHKIEYKRFDNNGIEAYIGRGKGPATALRADMDALKVLDLKDTAYRSQNEGLMHACGHDAHTAIQLGAAFVLKEIEEELKGEVRLIFQPAEETDGGARDMIEYGVLDGVKSIIGLHVDESLDTGIVGVIRGVVAAASNPFTINVYGKGSHGAYPENGIDAIMISAKVIANLQEIISREISGLDNAVITIGRINGGTIQNAICSSVTLEGILRTMGVDLRSFCKNRINDIVKSTAEMYRGRAEVSFVEGYPSFENADLLVDSLFETAGNIEGIKIKKLDRPSLGVEDFSYYTYKVPGLYYRLGCRNEAKGIIHPAHGSYFDVDEECMITGCAVQSALAFNSI